MSEINDSNPPAAGKMTTLVYTSRDEIESIYDYLGNYEQFETIDKNVSLDPHDEGNNREYINFRAKDGARLSKNIVDNDFILVGNDKGGMSAILEGASVPPGATLTVQMSTWVNLCHGGFGVHTTKCFGVGMFPVGSAKEQQWIYGEITTCIEDGVQYYACLGYEKIGGRGFGGRLGMAALGSGMNQLDYSFDVMQGGSNIRHSSCDKLSLDVIDVKISRDAAGNTEFSFVHQDQSCKINRPADAENKDMLFYFNCLGWADNNTYVQIHKVVLETPTMDKTKKTESDPLAEKKDVDEGSPAHKKPKSDGSVKSEGDQAATNEMLDYASILKDDAELRKQVDALIKSKLSKQNADE